MESSAFFEKLHSFILTGELPPTEAERRKLKRMSPNFTIKENRLFYTGPSDQYMRLVVLTLEEKMAVLKECHLNPGTGKHHGVRGTQNRVIAGFYWTTLISDVNEWVESCYWCQQNRSSASLHPIQGAQIGSSVMESDWSSAPSKVSLESKMNSYRASMDKLVHFLRTGQYLGLLSKASRRNIRNQAKNYFLDENNQLMYRRSATQALKVVTSEGEVRDVLRRCHGDATGRHRGINTTMSTIVQNHWWQAMKTDVIDFVTGCPNCQTQMSKKQKSDVRKLRRVIVNEPLEMVSLALMGPFPETTNQNKFILIFTDYFTKFVEFFPLQSQTSADVAKGIKSFIYRYGAPALLLSNQSRQFVAEINAEICAQFGIQHSIMSASHPLTIGRRTYGTLKVRLSRLANNQHRDWDQMLEEVAFSIRTEKKEPTKPSPFYLMFGRNARSPREMNPAVDQSAAPLPTARGNVIDCVSKRLRLQEAVCEQVRENLKSSRTKRREQRAKDKEAWRTIFHFQNRSPFLDHDYAAAAKEPPKREEFDRDTSQKATEEPDRQGPPGKTPGRGQVQRALPWQQSRRPEDTLASVTPPTPVGPKLELQTVPITPSCGDEPWEESPPLGTKRQPDPDMGVSLVPAKVRKLDLVSTSETKPLNLTKTTPRDGGGVDCALSHKLCVQR